MDSQSDAPNIWLPDIVDRIASFLTPNEIACTLRVLNKATALQFSQFRTVLLSRPSPCHAFNRRWGDASAYRAYSRKQRLKFLELTATSGVVSNVEVALASAGLFVAHKLLEAASGAGQLDVIKLLRGLGCPWDGSLAMAARGGHGQLCETLLANGCPFRQDAVYEAAYGGHEDLMSWLLKRSGDGRPAGAIDAGFLMMAAAVGFSLVPLQRLHQLLLLGGPQDGIGLGAEPPTEALTRERQGQVLASAAGSPTSDWQAKVEWLEGLRYPRMHCDCELAAARPDDADAVRRLKWLVDRGYPAGGVAATAAVVAGNLAALRFMMQQRPGLRPAAFVCPAAAGKGHLSVLQFLHSTGFTMSPQSVAASAAAEGQFPVVAWALEALGLTALNMPDLLDAGAKGGNIALMASLRQRSWTWGREAMSNAADYGCDEVLEWLVAHGCAFPVDGKPYRSAARQRDLATVRCLRRLGCPWGPHQLADCIRYNAPVPVLRGLIELGCPPDWEAAGRAAEARDSTEGRVEALEWVAEERQRQPPASPAAGAVA